MKAFPVQPVPATRMAFPRVSLQEHRREEMCDRVEGVRTRLLRCKAICVLNCVLSCYCSRHGEQIQQYGFRCRQQRWGHRSSSVSDHYSWSLLHVVGFVVGRHSILLVESDDGCWIHGELEFCRLQSCGGSRRFVPGLEDRSVESRDVPGNAAPSGQPTVSLWNRRSEVVHHDGTHRPASTWGICHWICPLRLWIRICEISVAYIRVPEFVLGSWCGLYGRLVHRWSKNCALAERPSRIKELELRLMRIRRASRSGYQTRLCPRAQQADRLYLLVPYIDYLSLVGLAESSVEFSGEIKRISSRLRVSESVLFITGAGLSADLTASTYSSVESLFSQP